MIDSAASAEETALAQRVLREHVASVYFTYTATMVARIAFVLVLGAFLYWQLRDPLVFAFVALHLVMYLCMGLMRRWTPQTPVAHSARWARRLVALVTVLGAADALAPWLFVPAGNLPVTCVLMVVMMGNCARAVQSLRPLKAAVVGHTVPMMGGLITALLWQGDSIHLFLATFSAIYLLMILRVGVQEHRQLNDALILRFENEALAARLGEQIAATERASAEKTRFLATASHDLRQPLHAIALFGAALENTLRDRPEGRNAQRLMRAVNALGTSLDSMLDVSRLDAGVVTPALQPVRLDALFVSLNHMFSAQAEQKELQLRVRASGLWVHSDPQLLTHMLSNLLDNALKYSRRGGATVTARLRGDRVCIDVFDTGIGIAPEQRGRVFEEFYQVGNPGRDRSHGLGIGLSIVRRLSHLLAHPVLLRSRPGRGTRFRIVLPVAAPEPAERFVTVSRAGSASLLQHSRVLLVDDEADIRIAMGELLHSHGVDALAVADEATAARALAEAEAQDRPFTLLVCDYRLAGDADGLDAGLRLRQRSAHALPLLLITGETAPERLQRVRASGVPVLFKPVDPATLLRTLGELGP